MSRQACWLVAGLLCGLVVSDAGADGFLVAKHRHRISGVYSVLYHHVDIKVDDQVARVQVSQAFQNPSHTTLEVEYFFPLPENAAIDNLTKVVNAGCMMCTTTKT